MNVMFDTNVFSNLASGKIDSTSVPEDWRCVAIYLQWQEIQATKNPEIRSKIESVFDEHLPVKAPPIAVWDVTPFDESVWAEPGNLYQSILEEMDRLKPHRNNRVDAVIAEACVRGKMALVTNDHTLGQAAAAHGVLVFNLQK
ncbi:hypothetical protein ACI3KW_17390 [Devosia sp. ZW T5_3]|uniref:hypothetical protein n=1 Tax=Devosia sp. ZW T5_3 TaxID=3378085 RepID=UPI003852D717